MCLRMGAGVTDREETWEETLARFGSYVSDCRARQAANSELAAYVRSKRAEEAEMSEKVRESVAKVDAIWPWLQWQ